MLSVLCVACYVISSVRLSVTRTDQSKTVEVKIMQFSPYGSLILVVFVGVKYIQKFGRVPPYRRRQTTAGGETSHFLSSCVYLENGRRYVVRPLFVIGPYV